MLIAAPTARADGGPVDTSGATIAQAIPNLGESSGGAGAQPAQPANVNLSVRVEGAGDCGPVAQANDGAASAAGDTSARAAAAQAGPASVSVSVRGDSP